MRPRFQRFASLNSAVVGRPSRPPESLRRSSRLGVGPGLRLGDRAPWDRGASLSAHRRRVNPPRAAAEVSGRSSNGCRPRIEPERMLCFFRRDTGRRRAKPQAWDRGVGARFAGRRRRRLRYLAPRALRSPVLFPGHRVGTARSCRAIRTAGARSKGRRSRSSSPCPTPAAARRRMKAAAARRSRKRAQASLQVGGCRFRRDQGSATTTIAIREALDTRGGDFVRFPHASRRLALLRSLSAALASLGRPSRPPRRCGKRRRGRGSQGARFKGSTSRDESQCCRCESRGRT